MRDVYDDDVNVPEYYEAPKQRGGSVGWSIFASVVTTAILFFGLRYADQKGFLGAAGKSSSEPMVEVPSLVGMALADARDLLKARELFLTLGAEREDPKIAAGAIAAQTPLAGSQVAHGSSVQAVLSRGAARAIVPIVAGLKIEEATKALTDKGLTIGKQKAEPSETVPAGAVLATDPAAGANLVLPASVDLTVSGGSAGKPVPKLTGMKLSKAKKTVEDAGFKLGTTRYIYDPNYGENIILKQEPAENTAAPPGSLINLIVNEPG